jgi:gamma-glutamyltranspeptidase/glutathione hydrolase
MALSKTDRTLRGMVTTAFPEATEAGWEVLRAGGNAVDAAIAAAWALAVCEPSGSGLGGQTVMLVRTRDGETVLIDGHSYAPAAVSLARVTRAQQKRGHRACAIPSTPATLGFAQQRYGLLPRALVMEPAIRLAEEGYPVTELQHRQMRWCLAGLRQSSSASRLLLWKGLPPPVGYTLRQRQLAATLRRLARQGTEDFYHGAIARSIAEDMREHGGLLTGDDLAALRLPSLRRALTIDYRGHRVASTPPPGGGFQLLLGLKICERLGLGEPGVDDCRWYQQLAEVIHLIFRERERSSVRPGDSPPVSYERLLDEERVGELADAIGCGYLGDGSGVNTEEPGETTHLCTADADGNVVSLTQSIQSLFGAKVANDRCGFFYNNYLVTCPRRPHPHQLSGGCVPRSNAAPTLVLRTGTPPEGRWGNSCIRRDEPYLALGAAGSRRITSSLLLVLSAVLDRKLSLADAVGLPRVHATQGGTVWLERSAATEQVRRRMACRFSAIRTRAPRSFAMGAVQAIQIRPEGILLGSADPRRDGTAIGR